MSQISEATGLPELPEGQWWEVRENYPWSEAFARGFPFSEFVVAIREKVTFTTLPEPGRYWWSKSKPAVTTSQTVDVARAGIDHPTLTPRLIRKAAFELVQKRNREAKSAALLGVYPPKKLGASA